MLTPLLPTSTPPTFTEGSECLSSVIEPEPKATSYAFFAVALAPNVTPFRPSALESRPKEIAQSLAFAFKPWAIPLSALIAFTPWAIPPSALIAL